MNGGGWGLEDGSIVDERDGADGRPVRARDRNREQRHLDRAAPGLRVEEPVKPREVLADHGTGPAQDAVRGEREAVGAV
ncbi:MAG: hypothetical protein ACRDNL_26720 [Spirillospora sp.]